MENEALHDQVRQSERDTVGVLSFLKGQDEQKDEQVSKAYCVLSIVFRLDGTQSFTFVCISSVTGKLCSQLLQYIVEVDGIRRRKPEKDMVLERI